MGSDRAHRRGGIASPVLLTALVALAIGMWLSAPLASSADTNTKPAQRGAEGHRLAREKLEAEIDKLQAEADDKSGIGDFFSNYAAFLTALAAFAGVIITIRGQNKEQTRQREADRADRARARRQRESESARNLEQRMSQLLLDLGSESEPVQAGATVSLLSFLGHEPELHRQVRLAVLANLKVAHSEPITKLLIRTFEASVANADQLPLDLLELDLSGAQLFGAQLRDLDLGNANLNNTNLANANLSGTRLEDAHGVEPTFNGAIFQGKHSSLLNAVLPKAQCAGAQFQGANLVNAHLEGADLRNARFDGARMQAAHPEYKADLRGARFDGANVADTYFREAIFDDDALRSLRRAKNWEKAHLDPADAARLRALTP